MFTNITKKHSTTATGVDEFVSPALLSVLCITNKSIDA